MFSSPGLMIFAYVIVCCAVMLVLYIAGGGPGECGCSGYAVDGGRAYFRSYIVFGAVLLGRVGWSGVESRAVYLAGVNAGSVL